MIDRKKVLRIIIEISLVIAIIVAFVLINELILDSKRKSFQDTSDTNKYVYQIEDLSIVNDEIVIKGWFFELKNVRNKEREVMADTRLGLVLYDMNSEIKRDLDGNEILKAGISMNMEYQDRKDIDSYFNCDYDYSHCGFIAKTNKSNIDLENGEYQIVIKPNRNENKGISIDSNTYIEKGRLIFKNPHKSTRLEVENTDLLNIVKDGYCLVDYPEYHIYVYQYDWKLYFIADEQFYFEEDGTTCIQYQIDTTQYNKLPAYRIEKGNYWSNIGADFEKYEITNSINCGKYRVCVRDIPRDYSVTRIVVGYYSENEWIWQKSFMPIYSSINNYNS